MANQDRVNFVWAESALTTIPPIPVSEVAYRDTTQTPEQMEVGQQYDTIYNSARHNQLLFLLTSVAKTLCENGIMPFLAGQEYSQYARCIFTDGKLYTASRAILANEQPYPTPGDDSGVWTPEETGENLVPNSRRVIAGTGLTGGGPLSTDVTLAVKLTDSVSSTDSTTAASAKAVNTAYDLASAGITAAQSTANQALNTANARLPLSGGTMTGRISGLRGQYTAEVNARYENCALEIRENDAVGNAQSEIGYAPTIGFNWAGTVAGTLALRNDGVFAFLQQNGTRAVVECEATYASLAGAANRLRTEGGVDTIWHWDGQAGQPTWMWGGVDGTNMYVYNPATFNVNYANSAGSANMKVYSLETYPNTKSFVLPAGGTWLVIASNDTWRGFIRVYPGGSTVTYDSAILANCIKIAE